MGVNMLKVGRIGLVELHKIYFTIDMAIAKESGVAFYIYQEKLQVIGKQYITLISYSIER